MYRISYRFLVPGWSAKPLVSAHDRIMGTHRTPSYCGKQSPKMFPVYQPRCRVSLKRRRARTTTPRMLRFLISDPVCPLARLAFPPRGTTPNRASRAHASRSSVTRRSHSCLGCQRSALGLSRHLRGSEVSRHGHGGCAAAAVVENRVPGFVGWRVCSLCCQCQPTDPIDGRAPRCCRK